MKNLTTLTTAAALVTVFGFSGAVQADPFADAVDGFTLGTGGAGDGTAALAAPDGVGHVLGDAGDLTLLFTNNICLDDGTAADEFGVTEVGDDETYAVQIGVASVGTLTNLGNGFGNETFNVGGAVAFFNRIKITDANTGVDGAEIDAVECFFTLDQADIVKAFAAHPDDPDDPDEIDQTSPGGPDIQQFKAFTIEITNNTGIADGLAGLIFIDVVPAEFDLDPNPDDQGDGGALDGVEVTDNYADCTASGTEGGAKGKGKGNQKLAPEVITIDAGSLDDGESCEVTVWVMTDNDHPGRGRNPNWTPTSCPVTLNDAVKVFDANFNLLLQDDDSLVFDDDDPVSEGVCNPS